MVCQVRTALDHTDMPINGKRVQLSPGMAVTVEVKTGARRMLSDLLTPSML